jgi:pyroglutamyl-peptidase
MKRLLLTGFLPFGEEPVNPSGEAARALHGLRRGDWRVISVVLPVTYAGAVRAMDAALKDVGPSAVLSLGQGGDRFQVETLARNHVDARADNDGVVPAAGPIDSALQDAPSRLPVDRMLNAVSGAVSPLRCVPSEDAGGYVCNHTLFHLVHRTSLPVGFLHVPRIKVAALSTVLAGVKAAVAAVCDAPAL